MTNRNRDDNKGSRHCWLSGRNVSCRLLLGGSLVASFVFSLVGQNVQAQTPETSTAVFDIEPMTQVHRAEHLGYFGDPYPVHIAQWLEPAVPQYISGTTRALMQCGRPIKPECFSSEPLSVKVSDSLKSEVQVAGNIFGDQINRNIYQTLDGVWQMAITLYVHPKDNSKERWTIIAHARSADESPSVTPPTTWIADKVLVGSLATSARANYDGKYFEDNSHLYLIYSKRLDPSSAKHDGVVAQEMAGPTELALNDPVTLLAPSDTNRGFNSEYFHTDHAPDDKFKLIETGNITKIAGKYVMAYSAGDYQQPDYKTGIAYSDTLLPPQGQTYRRILEKDESGVWGQPNHREVRYLLQSQKADWPNYVASAVIGPGVPSIVREPSGEYFLFFDGFLPGDTPQAPDTPNNPNDIKPDQRRPFFVALNVNVPAVGSVSAASEKQLATWITPHSK